MDASVPSVEGATGPTAALGRGRQVLLGVVFVVGLLFAVLAGVDTFSILTELPFAAVGAVLVIRRPANSIGWLLLVVAALGVTSAWQLSGPAGPLVTGTAPMGDRAVVWLAAATGSAIFPCYALLAVVFPSGRLPEGRWGRVVRILIGLNALLLVTSAIGPTVSANLTDGSTIDAANPFGLLPVGSWWQDVGGAVGFSFVLGSTAIAVLSFVVRLVRARGLERQQQRWVAASLVLSVIAVGVAIPTGAWALAFAAFATIPVAIGIAVLRYRLYEIDTIINRAIVYALLTAILAGLTTTVVGLAERVIAGLVGPGSDTSIIVSTLVVVSAFEPVKKRVQALVDRRFKEVVDPEVVLAAYLESLRKFPGVLSADRTLQDLLEVAARAYRSEGGELTTVEARHAETLERGVEAPGGQPQAQRLLRFGKAGANIALEASATSSADGTTSTIRLFGKVPARGSDALGPALARAIEQIRR